MATSRIVELASQIQKRTSEIDEYLQSNNLPSPTFDEDGPVDLGLSAGEVAKARDAVLESTLELHDLLLGPSLCLRPVVRHSSVNRLFLN